jgi:hypothetical protein
MDSSVSPKDEILFLGVCHHISNAVYTPSRAARKPLYSVFCTSSSCTNDFILKLITICKLALTETFELQPTAIQQCEKFLTKYTTAQFFSDPLIQTAMLPGSVSFNRVKQHSVLPSTDTPKTYAIIMFRKCRRK